MKILTINKDQLTKLLTKDAEFKIEEGLPKDGISLKLIRWDNRTGTLSFFYKELPSDRNHIQPFVFKEL